jgi:hypothetical protein
VKGRLDLAVADLGPIQLKNIAEPVRVYSLEVGQPAQAKPAPTPMPEKTTPPRLSIVVLLFANIGGDPEQEHFVDGVMESLTTDLSRIRGAVVIGRNTAFTYKGKAVDLRRHIRSAIRAYLRNRRGAMSRNASDETSPYTFVPHSKACVMLCAAKSGKVTRKKRVDLASVEGAYPVDSGFARCSV